MSDAEDFDADNQMAFEEPEPEIEEPRTNLKPEVVATGLSHISQTSGK
jgi:hypothetical protein